jgi:hypothetical protein
MTALLPVADGCGPQIRHEWRNVRTFDWALLTSVRECSEGWRRYALDPGERWLWATGYHEREVYRLDFRDGTVTKLQLPPGTDRRDGDLVCIALATGEKGRLYVAAASARATQIAFTKGDVQPLQHELLTYNKDLQLIGRTRFAIADQGGQQYVSEITLTEDGYALVASYDVVSLHEIQRLSCLDPRGHIVWSKRAGIPAGTPYYKLSPAIGDRVYVQQDSSLLVFRPPSEQPERIPVKMKGGESGQLLGANGARSLVWARHVSIEDRVETPFPTITFYSPMGNVLQEADVPSGLLPTAVGNRAFGAVVRVRLFAARSGAVYLVDDSRPAGIKVSRVSWERPCAPVNQP